MISGFKLEALANCGYSLATRKLANKPSSLRIFNRPRSGRMLRSMPSHLGPPTAPNNTASAARAFCNVSSGKGTPALSIAAPPKSPSSKVRPSSNFSLTAFNTATA